MLGRPGRPMGGPIAKNWSPLDLSSLLLAWWDSSVGVSLNGASVTAWADRKSGISVTQATEASRPQLGATSFNGVPGVTFDGVADRLAISPVPAVIPVGANPAWVYAVLQQNALAADATNRYILQYGGLSTNASRHFRRSVITGTNRLNAISGTGGSLVSVNETTVDFSGRKLAIAKFGATAVAVAADASADVSSAAVPATDVTTLVIGSSAGSTLFANMILRDLIITAPLSAADEVKLEAFLMARRLV